MSTASRHILLYYFRLYVDVSSLRRKSGRRWRKTFRNCEDDQTAVHSMTVETRPRHYLFQIVLLSPLLLSSPWMYNSCHGGSFNNLLYNNSAAFTGITRGIKTFIFESLFQRWAPISYLFSHLFARLMTEWTTCFYYYYIHVRMDKAVHTCYIKSQKHIC